MSGQARILSISHECGIQHSIDAVQLPFPNSSQTAEMNNAVKARIEFLDYLRIVAFMSVLIGHKLAGEVLALQDSANHVTLRVLGEALFPLFFGGAAGIIVFFLASGYIITHVLQHEAPTDFLIRRIFRIYPLFVFAVLVEILFHWMNTGSLPPQAAFPVLIPTLLLLGDFFGSPYVIGGVDWTLRIEILFYVFMAVLRYAGLITRVHLLPLVFVVCAAMLYKMNPFPSLAGWSTGYFNIYAPFLLIGSIIYLAEHTRINKAYLAGSVLFIFALHLMLIGAMHPRWKETHYALIATGIFLSSWLARGHFVGNPIVRVLADITYAVYLFHNWLWQYLEYAIRAIGITAIPVKLQIIAALFVFCYLAHQTIEKRGIALGRKVAGAYRTWKVSAAPIASTVHGGHPPNRTAAAPQPVRRSNSIGLSD